MFALPTKITRFLIFRVTDLCLVRDAFQGHIGTVVPTKTNFRTRENETGGTELSTTPITDVKYRNAKLVSVRTLLQMQGYSQDHKLYFEWVDGIRIINALNSYYSDQLHTGRHLKHD